MSPQQQDFDISMFADIPDPLAAKAAPKTGAGSVPPPATGSFREGATKTEADTNALSFAERNAGPTTAQVKRRRLIAAAAAIVWLLFVLALEGTRDGFAWTPTLLLQTVFPGILGATAWWLAMSPGPLGLGPSYRSVVTFAVAAPLAFIGGALLSPCLTGPPVAEHAFLCGDWILLLGAVSLGIVVFAQRRTVATGVSHRSLLLGVSTGFAATAVHSLHCDNTTGLHVAIAHTWPVIVLGLLGLLFARRAVRV